MNWRTLLVVAAVLLENKDVTGQNSRPRRGFSSFRLPNSTVPTHYSLQLDTDIDRGIFEYTGKLQIEIKVVEPTDQIVLHSVRSVIKSLKLRNGVQNQTSVKGYEFDKEKEFLVINVGEVLQPTSGIYTLDIAFTNNIDRHDRVGFYRSSYVSANGTTRHLGLTQFEPIDARTAFPCYDEPEIKASFEIVITCGLEYHARSNTPGNLTIVGDRKIFKFEKTPPMQTYLVAWLVSDFVGEEATLPQTNLTVATWAKPPSANLLTFSVNASKRFIPEMEQYFNERYSLPKIDNVAIADRDFENGAMENWGLVTYRESMVLFDPLKHGFRQQVTVVETIAHEYIHQFFGNLLAPKWWSFLWLNEGLARFYECYIGSLSHPDLIQREHFVLDTMQKAFNVDKWPNVMPMTHYDETRQEIRQRFGNVVYDKAASVLRMMHYALGERTFQKGLRYYLQQNKARGVVEESNLFDSLDQAAKEDKALPVNLSMHEIFGSWSNQAGVPIVSVRRDGDEFYFTQTRYYAEPQQDPLNSSWWIPISFSTQTNTAYEKLPAFWMPPHVSEVSYSIPLAEGETVTFNPHSTGYYRISYEEPLLDELIQRLSTDHSSIQPAARARLIDDTLNIAYRDGGDYSAALKLMSYLRDETDYVPWVVAYENLRYLKTMLRGDAKASGMLQTFAEQLAAPLLEKYSIAKRSHESANDEELRSIAIELACSASESCKSAAMARVNVKARSVENFYNANDRALVCTGLHLARADERKEFAEHMSYEMESQSDDPFARKYIREAVDCTGNNVQGVRYLYELEESVRSKSLYHLIVGMKVTPNSVIQTLHEEISQRQSIHVKPATIAQFLLELTHYVTDSSEIDLFRSAVSQIAPSVASEIDYQLQANRKWIERNVKPLTTALSQILAQ